MVHIPAFGRRQIHKSKSVLGFEQASLHQLELNQRDIVFNIGFLQLLVCFLRCRVGCAHHNLVLEVRLSENLVHFEQLPYSDEFWDRALIQDLLSLERNLLSDHVELRPCFFADLL